MTVKELIAELQLANPDHPVKIFNIVRDMDILQVDINPTRLDEHFGEIPIKEVWLTIGFEAEKK